MIVDKKSADRANCVSIEANPAFTRDTDVLTAAQRLRRNVMEAGKSSCRTRLSTRRLMIRMQADSATDLMRDPVRFYGGSGKNPPSGRVVDWD
jgi:hypothetical protein